MKRYNLPVRWQKLVIGTGLVTLAFLLPTATAFAQSSSFCRSYARDYSLRYSAGGASRGIQRSVLFDRAYARCMHGRWP